APRTVALALHQRRGHTGVHRGAAGGCRAGCFFFQAEDGIRDRTVTGVQTCALPISRASNRPDSAYNRVMVLLALVLATALQQQRSEERRVGKECRSRRVAD